jgi:hypothetical protein
MYLNWLISLYNLLLSKIFSIVACRVSIFVQCIMMCVTWHRINGTFFGEQEHCRQAIYQFRWPCKQNGVVWTKTKYTETFNEFTVLSILLRDLLCHVILSHQDWDLLARSTSQESEREETMGCQGHQEVRWRTRLYLQALALQCWPINQNYITSFIL